MNKKTNIKVVRRKKVRLRIRKKIFGTPEVPRLAVYKSNRGLSCQIIDDVNGKTLCSSSYLAVEKKGTRTEVAKEVGTKIAAIAKEKDLNKVVFDRSGYLYHGVVKAFGDAAREGGLEF